FAEGLERTRALGVIGSVTGVGFAAGALLGGLLTGYLSWRWVFFVNVPICALALGSARALLPAADASAAGARRAWDLGGVVTGTAGLAILVLAITRLSAPAGGGAQALAFGVLAVTLLTGFLTIERRSRRPLVPLGIFRTPGLTAANLVVCLNIAD